MKKLLTLCLALVSMVIFPAGSCGSSGTIPVSRPVTTIDAGPVSVIDCNRYCDHLKNLPCSEGTNPKCLDTCNKVLEANLVKIPFDCVMAATTVEAASVCGAKCN
jgi:hypothetical protein